MSGKVVISKGVENETVIDTSIYPEIAKIRESIDKRFIEVKEVKKSDKVVKLMRNFGLGKGEAETIQLYFQEKADLLLCDEKKARKIASILNINLLGTPELIIQLYKRKFIGKEKAKESVLKLEKIGWFKSSIIFEALKEIGD